MQLQTVIKDLNLRRLRSSDAEELHALIQQNREHLTRLGDYLDYVALTLRELRDELERPNPRERNFGPASLRATLQAPI